MAQPERLGLPRPGPRRQSEWSEDCLHTGALTEEGNILRIMESKFLTM